MRDQYQHPLCTRYASEQMHYIFSDNNKFSTWRKLWIALAEGQQTLGLDISNAQLEEMRNHADNINYDAVAKIERDIRHDVMAHIKAYGLQCPTAAPIIHLGATSCYVGDNTDIIVYKSALQQVKRLLLNAMAALYELADKHRDLPCMAYTHFQEAQPTTFGKRVTLWLQDLQFDLEQLDFTLEGLKLLGCKGATGTAASFLSLFENNHDKVIALEKYIAKSMGFNAESVYPVSGQTYSRKVDYYILSVLSGIAQSTYKFSNDIRLLCHLKEVDEPFETGQVGSSAMAYKRNPMRSERIAALARYVMVDALNPALTAAGQWLERTLDDSANKRMVIPEAFLATDGILSLVINIASGMVVYPNRMARHLNEALPFIATENILMHCVKKGGNRQQLHENIRQHAMAAADTVKQGGTGNDLIQRILDDSSFNISTDEMEAILRSDRFTGCAVAQTTAFLSTIKTILEGNKTLLGMEVEIYV